MDEAAIEARGAAPLEAVPRPDRRAAGSKRELPRVLARAAAGAGDSGLFFGFGSSQDFADSSRVIAFAMPAAWACPTATTTLKTMRKSKEIRAKYVAHVARMFELLGEAPGGGAHGRRDA